MTRRDLRNAEREWRATRPTPRRFHVKPAPRRSAAARLTDAAIRAVFRTVRLLGSLNGN